MLIASHVNPDGDSIGSQLAMYDFCRALGAEPSIVSNDPITTRYRFLSRCDLIGTYDKETSYSRFDTAVVLEATDLGRIGDVQDLIDPECTIVNIDHHTGNSGYGALNLLDETASAAGILVYHLFQEAGIELSDNNALELLTAIITDTGRFCFTNTSAEALQISARLIEAGASPKQICDAVYSGYSEDQVRLLGELIAGMELHHDGRTCILVCDRATCSKYAEDAAEMEGLVNYALFTEGVQVGILLREIEKEVTKVSLRSSDSFDVGSLARRYLGGGHPNAAGCYINKPIRQARTELLKQIAQELAS